MTGFLNLDIFRIYFSITKLQLCNRGLTNTTLYLQANLGNSLWQFCAWCFAASIYRNKQNLQFGGGFLNLGTFLKRQLLLRRQRRDCHNRE